VKKTVKINQGLSNFAEPEEGEKYEIINVSNANAKGYKGLTIEFAPEKQTEQNKKINYRVTAWFGQNETVGTKSKLGAFINAFTDYFETEEDSKGVPQSTDKALEMAQNTDNWLNHIVKIVSWKNKSREIKVIS
jgi:hypothetical protein